MAEGLFIDVRMFPFPFGIIYSSAIVNYIEMLQFSSDEYIEKVDLTEYELIGFASGIYYSKFHESVLKVAMEYLPQNKRVFLIYTYGFKRTGYGEDIAKIICEKRGQIVASYGCRGFDTFGPFKIVGGIAKGHPTDEEISEAVRVIKEFM